MVLRFGNTIIFYKTSPCFATVSHNRRVFINRLVHCLTSGQFSDFPVSAEQQTDAYPQYADDTEQ